MVVTRVWSVKGIVKMFKDTNLQLVNKQVLKIYSIIITDNVLL